MVETKNRPDQVVGILTPVLLDVHFTNAESKFFSLLTPETVIPYQQLLDPHLAAHQDDQRVRTQVFNLRQKLAGTDWQILSVNDVGYYLTSRVLPTTTEEYFFVPICPETVPAGADEDLYSTLQPYLNLVRKDDLNLRPLFPAAERQALLALTRNAIVSPGLLNTDSEGLKVHICRAKAKLELLKAQGQLPPDFPEILEVRGVGYHLSKTIKPEDTRTKWLSLPLNHGNKSMEADDNLYRLVLPYFDILDKRGNVLLTLFTALERKTIIALLTGRPINKEALEDLGSGRKQIKDIRQKLDTIHSKTALIDQPFGIYTVKDYGYYLAPKLAEGATTRFSAFTPVEETLLSWLQTKKRGNCRQLMKLICSQGKVNGNEVVPLLTKRDKALLFYFLGKISALRSQAAVADFLGLSINKARESISILNSKIGHMEVNGCRLRIGPENIRQGDYYSLDFKEPKVELKLNQA